jgi:hypothetical protein
MIADQHKDKTLMTLILLIATDQSHEILMNHIFGTLQ